MPEIPLIPRSELISRAWDLYKRYKSGEEAARPDPALLREALALPLPWAEEKVLNNTWLWALYRQLKALAAREPLPAAEMAAWLEASSVLAFDPAASPQPQAQLLRMALKIRKNYPGFVEYVQRWDLRRLQPGDYVPFQPEGGGRPVMALAEQAWIGYAGGLLQREGMRPGSARPAMEALLPLLEELARQHPAYEYPALYLGKLCLALGRQEQALGHLQRFLHKKPGEYWAWSALAEALEGAEPEKALACLIRAAVLPGDDAYRVRVREQLAFRLRDAGHLPEARAEFDRLIAARQRERWPIPARVIEASAEPWFAATPAPAAYPPPLYAQYAALADEVLAGGSRQVAAIAVFIEPETQLVRYRVSQQQEGRFPLRIAPWAVEAGDLLELSLVAGKEEGRPRVLQVRRGEALPEAARRFRGRINLQPNRMMAFVEGDIFIPGNLIQAHALQQGCQVEGIAGLSYNKTRESWGWRALRLERR
jgi:tetratricopeptide (TPR) repeat protein